MAAVTFDGVTLTYPGLDVPAVGDLHLEVADGELLVLAGPAGCGRSTTLRLLAGLEEVGAGRVLLDGQDVTRLSSRERDVAMVLQSYALYPHLTVGDNLGFAMRVAGIDDDEVARRVAEAAEVLDLTDQLDQTPAELTRDLRHRVAMGRAIVRAPQVFIMDDPLVTLDPAVRAATRDQLSALQRRLGVTTLYATSQPDEALAIGDRVAVLRDGVLQQCDTPQRLREAPANPFVAAYLGV